MPTFKPKILLVDDEPQGREGLARALRAKGYDVLEAGTGGEVHSRARSDWPALIILDIVLPDIPGTEVFKTLRADPITKAIPVLLLTAKPDILDQAGVQIPEFQSRSDRYFEKPGRLEDLLGMVREMLTGKR